MVLQLGLCGTWSKNSTDRFSRDKAPVEFIVSSCNSLGNQEFVAKVLNFVEKQKIHCKFWLIDDII